MVRRLMLYGGLLLACLLIGQLALNATGVERVVLDKATPSEAGKVVTAKKAGVGTAEEDLRAKAAERALYGLSDRTETNSGRKALEDAARATGVDPARIAELSDSELNNLLKNVPAVETKAAAPITKEVPAVDQNALSNAADKLEAELLKARFEEEEGIRAAGSTAGHGSALPSSHDDQNGGVQYEEKTLPEASSFISPAAEPEQEIPAAVEDLRARELESLEQRMDRGESLSPTEKDYYSYNQPEIAETPSHGGGGSLDNTGADSWGYAYTDNVAPEAAPYNWIELRGDAGATWPTMSGTDAGTAPWVQLGFSFPFYGVNYDSIKISNDGNIQFTTTSTAYTNTALPSTTINGPVIFAFWDDQKLNSFGGTTSNRIAYRAFTDSIVVEWDSTAIYASACDSQAMKYEVILYNNGVIRIQYDQVGTELTCDSSATIGIQSSGAAGSAALQYCYGSSGTNFTGPHIAAGRSIQFAPVTWTHNFATTAITSPSAVSVYGPSQSVPVTATFTNLAVTDESAPVKYSFDGGATVEEATGILARWATESHTFSTNITMPASPGAYTLTVWSDLATDEYRGNDTLRTTVNVILGGDCGNEVVITTAADSATYSNCNMGGSNTPGIPCVTTIYNDMVFKKDVQAGNTVSFWLTTNSWPTWSPRFALRWGGACPGANTVNCVSGTPYNQPIVWTNSTGALQTVYFVVGGSSSTYCGNFKVNWKDEICAAVDVPYTQGFEATPFAPVLPGCMTQENGDGIPPVWGSYGTSPRTGLWDASISSITAGVNDWLFTPGINMEEGRDYFVSYWRRVSAAASPDSVEVMAGLAPTAAAMNITAMAMDSCKRIVYTQKLGGFTCPASGVYYIGWHNVSKRSGSRTYIDDISIDASNVCSTGTVSVSAATAVDSVTLIANLGGNWFGGVPRYQWYTGTDCVNGNQVPGATLSSYKTFVSGTFSCRVYVVDSLTCVACDSGYAEVVDCQTGAYGLSEGFEAVTTPALPICWLQQNLDTYTYTWVTSTTTPHSGTKVAAVYGYVSDGSAPNDWLYSRALQMSSDTLYHVGYWVRLSSTTYTRMLELFAGTAQNNAAMTIPVETQYTVGNTTWAYREATFTPPTTGVYFVGWHATSPATQSGYIYVDDVTVWAHGLCSAPSSVTVNSVVGADSAMLKAVALGGFGGAYEYQWYTGVDCQTGNEVVGATTDSLWVLASGTYSCKAYIINAVDCALCDSGYANVVNCSIPLTVPFTEGFESTTLQLLPVCWTQIDVDGDGRPWRSNTSYARSGLRHAYNQYSTGDSTNDWMFTRGVSLTAGETIVVDYWYRCALTSATYSESLELMAGTAPNVGSMTIIVDTNFVFSAVATYQLRSGLMIVPSTGTYYFGWHAGYLINQGGVCVDDISVYEYGACGAPTVDVPAVSSSIFATLTCGVTGGFGGPLQYQWYTGTPCTPGNEIAGATARQYTTFTSGVFSCKAWFVDPVACSACDSAEATIVPDPCLPGSVPPIFEPWANTGLPTCWSQENGNGDSYSWNSSTTYYYSSPYAAYLYTSTTPANDWLFSGPVQLTADSTYRIQYWRRASSATYTQTLKLAVGTNRHSTAMTTVLLTPYTFNSIVWAPDVAQYTAPATGSYYFGLQNLTSVSSGSVYADDFRIYKIGDCGAPTAVTAAAAVGPDSAGLTATVTGGFGGPIQYQWYTGETCTPGNEIVGATNATYWAQTTGTYACLAYYVNAGTCGLCDSAYATVLPCNTNPVTTWPFLESFEGLTTPNLPECWRRQDVNGDNRIWSSSASYYRTGTRSAYVTYSSSGTFPVDDWLFTKALSVTAGDTVVVDYWYRCALTSASYTEALEVKAGTGARADLMTITVDPLFTFSAVATHLNHTPYFIAPTTGIYYVGWHCSSGINQGGIAIDDIAIYPSSFCEAPTVDVPAVANPGTVTLTATPTGGWGTGPYYQWYTGVACAAGNEIAGANSAQYTTATSGVYSCKVLRGACFACDSAYADILVPGPGEVCGTAFTLTPPVVGTPTVVTGTTVGFYPNCTVMCPEASSGPDLFYVMTLAGTQGRDCRRIAIAMAGDGTGDTDPFLSIYQGLGNCCGTPLYCNDDAASFTPLPGWDVPAQHPALSREAYIAAELEPGTYYIRVSYWSTLSGPFTLSVYDNGYCNEPCDSAQAFTVYLNPTNPSQVWWHFNALSTGTYKVFTTTVKNNDGNPDNGADPQWSLDTTLEITAIGAVECADLDGGPAVNGYENFSVVHDCPIIGRCCYGEITAPTCVDNEQADCLTLGGTWDRWLRCATTPCPVSGAGETCESAIMVSAFPYTVTGASTAGYANDYILYNDSPPCLSSSQSSYGNGFDVIYKFTLTSATNLTFLYGRAGWGSLTIHNACPATGTCVGGIKNPSEAWMDLVVPCASYAAGTYYVMIDSWTGYDPYTYNLTIQTCTP